MNKKYIFTCIISLLMTGCLNVASNNNLSSILNNSSSTESTNTKSITNVEVNNYNNKIHYLRDLNEEEISLKITYSDNSFSTIDYQNLEFDYSNFDNKKLGNQNINVSVKGQDIIKELDVEVIPADKLNVLMIGNSFSDDTAQWVNEICNDLGINVNIGNLYIGGCSLDTHFNNLMKDSSLYEFRTYNKYSKSWITQNNTSISSAMEYYDWDFVTLQQASGDSGIESSFSNLDGIIELVSDMSDNVKFIWNMTWAYQQNSTHNHFVRYNNNQKIMYQSIVNCVQSIILNNEMIEAVIPNGTAIQNARSSYVGDNLTRDGYHLSLDLGRYIAGLSLVKAITGQDISNIKYKPNNMSEDYKRIAIESVNNAFNNPFEVTNSSFDIEPVYDLSNHIEIDYQPVGCAYYYSTHTENYNKLITNVNNSMNFVASKKFTKDELPIGSVIEIKKGYQYRPEGWIDDKVQINRENNVTTRYVEVDEAWWGNYIYRAFNISSNTGSSLMYCMKEAVDSFSIYVPKDANIDLSNPYEIDDTELFKNNSLDISNYDSYDYIYQNGFYNSSANNNQEIAYIGSFAGKFICTETFTKETLPIGSVIVVDSGYQYRPDAWVGDEINNNRPNNVTTNVVVVDEAWWGDYTIKGFNISRLDSTDISQTPYETTSHFRIYIPKM